jgi:predicted nucleic acid-binding protein
VPPHALAGRARHLPVADTSAWIRQRDPAERARWKTILRAGLLATCPVVALEVGRHRRPAQLAAGRSA